MRQINSRCLMQMALAISLAMALATLVFLGSASADPANASLEFEVSDSVLGVGESFLVTVTLTTGDGEPFGDWQVELLYDESVLDVDEVWANDTVVPPFQAPVINMNPGDLYIADGAFQNNAGDTDPYLLSVITFTAQSEGSSAFSVRTNPSTPENDTHYADVSVFPPNYYIPETINVDQIAVADYEWIGTVDDDWQTSGNWLPNGVPGATDAVGIPGGMNNYPLLNNNNAVDALHILPGAWVEVPSAYELTAETVHNYGSLVLWEDVNDGVQTDFHLYDSGSGVSYYGTEITSNGAMNTTRVTVKGRQNCTDLDEPGDTVDRCFEITPGQQPTYADIRFYYLDIELDGQDPATMGAWHWNTNTMTWTVAGTGATPGGTAPNHYVDVTQITDFSPFVLKSGLDQPTAISILDMHAAGEWRVGGVGVLGVLTLSVVIWRFRRRYRQQI